MMSLSEKITALRMGQKLSQGDVAEKLGVSRQSVSKWETGQSVPELDKIVKLADLFGVSLDELVRDGEEPRPTPPQGEATEPRIVYVERRRLAPVQILGIIFIVAGLVSLVLGTCLSPYFLIAGVLLIALGLPFLLAKKHPFLIAGWVIWGLVSLVWCSPFLRGASVTPLHGFVLLAKFLMAPAPPAGQGVLAFVPLGLLIELPLAVLTVALVVFTALACLRRWRARNENREAPSA